MMKGMPVSAMRAKAAESMKFPVGLFGLATMMTLVLGVMALRMPSGSYCMCSSPHLYFMGTLTALPPAIRVRSL